MFETKKHERKITGKIGEWNDNKCVMILFAFKISYQDTHVICILR